MARLLLLLLPRVAMLLVAAASAAAVEAVGSAAPVGSGELGGGLSRDDFPGGFVFGAGTSAYQVSSRSSTIVDRC
jgi:beta-glucosidase